MAKVLVVGGAGYVGGATCAWLIDQGNDVWVLDDLSTGHRELVLDGVRGFLEARTGDRSKVLPLLEREKFDCVMHFAARSLVAESVRFPEDYYENNVLQTEALLEMCAEAGVRNFIFSSSCAVFGAPEEESTAGMDETLPRKPMSPYGMTKLEAERLLERAAKDKGIRSIALRYFNAAGAEPKLRTGEWHDHETHLIPNVLRAAERGTAVQIFGTDYPTPDGTCIRDYIHVTDLAAAQTNAMEKLLRLPSGPNGFFRAYNLGSETGYSVIEVIGTCEIVLGRKITVEENPRRAGDPPVLIADSRLARAEIGFGQKLRGLEEIIRSAYEWEKKGVTRARVRRAVFLDRDGTINEDPGYLADPEQLKLLPGAAEALHALKNAGFRLVVVSNQSGVGRGLIAPDALPKIHHRLESLLRPDRATIDHFELCVHHPDEQCDCRKPKPRLILDAAARLGVDVARSYMVGDKGSDIGAGRAAGCKASVLVRTGYGLETERALKPGEASFVADSLLEAARWILDQETANS
ncbi:MAG: UDP-glucose 4-epimerase GalE [Bdellovibrionota bacterium]